MPRFSPGRARKSAWRGHGAAVAAIGQVQPQTCGAAAAKRFPVRAGGQIDPSLISSAQWHATVWPVESVRSSGRSSVQRVGWTYGQRVWNRHALGGFAGLGRSPVRKIARALLSTAGSGIGTAESSVIVYGCSGLS